MKKSILELHLIFFYILYVMALVITIIAICLDVKFIIKIRNVWLRSSTYHLPTFLYLGFVMDIGSLKYLVISIIGKSYRRRDGYDLPFAKVVVIIYINFKVKLI